MHVRRRIPLAARRLVPLAVAVTLLAAACGSSGDGGGGGEAAAAATIGDAAFAPGPDSGWSDSGITVDQSAFDCATPGDAGTRGVTDTEIKVGGLLSLTSPAGPANSGTDVGAKVRFDRANAEGGVNGRTINFVGVRDDGADAARTSTQAAALVAEGIFASVPTSVRTGNILDSYCRSGTPFFGWGTTKSFCNSTLGFGVTGCLVAEDKPPAISTTWAMAARGILGGSTGRSIGFVGVDLNSAAAGINLAAKGMRAAGFTTPYVKNAVPAAGLTDPTPLVNDLMRADKGTPPDLIVTIVDFNPAIKLISALRAAGYKGDILTPLGYDPRLAGFKELDNTYTLVQWAPTESGSAADTQLKADFARYAPQQAISLTAMAGYWSADLFLDAVRKTGRDLTAKSLLKTLNGGGYSYHVAGAVGEARFPLAHNISVPCASVVHLTGGAYEQTVKLACTTLVPNK